MIDIRQLKHEGEVFYPQTCIQGVVDSDGNLLDIDTAPVSGSNNLVKSGGVFEAIQNNPQNGYYVCETSAATAAKEVSATGYVLSLGGSIKVKMTNANTADNATLNINSAGVKPLYYDGERASANNSWEAGETVEVYYDGTSYYANNVAGGSGSGDGTFDVSVKYPTSGVGGGNTYTLDGALAVLNASLSVSKKKGGMSIKFIQASSDNNYVQYRLMSDTFNTSPVNWRGVDDEPVVYSNNLITSGGVAEALKEHQTQIDPSPVANSMNPVAGGYVYRMEEHSISCENDNSDADLNLGDTDGNVILSLKNGRVRTKSFDSEGLAPSFETPVVGEDNSDADLDFGDKYGNVILSLKDGHIKTKNFDSRNGTGYQHKYYGQRIEIKEYSFDISTYMTMVNPTGKGNQGMDIWGGVLFSAKDTGYVCLYDFANKQTNPFATIQLASASAENHSNVLNLAAQQAEGSPYPLMYVSVGNVGVSIECYCHVEKVIENGGVYSSQLIQTIILDASGFSAAGFQSIFGSPLWLLDKVRNQLWVFSAIKRTTEEATGNMRTNKYVATCFNVPDISLANVTLTADDIVKQSIFEFDAYATQGGCIYNGIIYYTFGFGGTTGNSTAKIRVFDTDNDSILSRINLAGIMNGEPEDCCVYNGKLYMQTAGTSLFVFDF